MKKIILTITILIFAQILIFGQELKVSDNGNIVAISWSQDAEIRLNTGTNYDMRIYLQDNSAFLTCQSMPVMRELTGQNIELYEFKIYSTDKNNYLYMPFCLYVYDYLLITKYQQKYIVVDKDIAYQQKDSRIHEYYSRPEIAVSFSFESHEQSNFPLLTIKIITKTK